MMIHFQSTIYSNTFWSWCLMMCIVNIQFQQTKCFICVTIESDDDNDDGNGEMRICYLRLSLWWWWSFIYIQTMWLKTRERRPYEEMCLGLLDCCWCWSHLNLLSNNNEMKRKGGLLIILLLFSSKMMKEKRKHDIKYICQFDMAYIPHTICLFWIYQVNIKQNAKQGILLRRNNFENVNRFKEKNDYYFKCLINQELWCLKRAIKQI